MRRFLLPLGILAASALPLRAEQILWPLADTRPPANPAATATAKLDWFTLFQGMLKETRGHHYDVLFDGDSITLGWHRAGSSVWTARYGNLNKYDFGISGDRTEHVLWRLANGQVDGLDPKLVVLLIGTNNTGRDAAQPLAEGVAAIVKEYLTRCPHAHLLLMGIFPKGEAATDPSRAKIVQANKLLATLASERVTFLDIGEKFLQPDGTISREIMSDFTHPTGRGYQIWADAIQPVMDRYVPKSKNPPATVPEKAPANANETPTDP